MKRGRKSSVSIGIAVVPNSVTSTDRLEAPLILTDAERDVWYQVVNDQPASFFTPTHAPLLEMYCRHVVQSRVLADQILNFDRKWLADDDGLKRYDRLLAMQEREGRAASSIATRLRITKQAIDQQTVARTLINQPKARKPWELPEPN
jgi:hypothetical protein